MILKNSKGMKKDFNILFELIKGNKKYLVYSDPLNDNVYAGLEKNNKLKELNDREFEYINKLINELKE